MYTSWLGIDLAGSLENATVSSYVSSVQYLCGVGVRGGGLLFEENGQNWQVSLDGKGELW